MLALPLWFALPGCPWVSPAAHRDNQARLDQDTDVDTDADTNIDTFVDTDINTNRCTGDNSLQGNSDCRVRRRAAKRKPPCPLWVPKR